MFNPHEIRRLEVEAELSKLQATQAEARAKAAQFEAERALLTPQVINAPAAPATAARLGAGIGTVLAIAIAAAVAGWAMHRDADGSPHGPTQAGFYYAR